MSFLQLPQARVVPGFGRPESKIAIVGEAPGAHEDMQLKPFVGPAGGVLDNCMQAAQLIRSDCYLTNVVKIRPRNNDITPFFDWKKGRFTLEGNEWCKKLYEELDGLEANVIVAMGATAQAALTGYHKINKYRGYIFPSIGLSKPRKVIPAIHPAATLRGQYIQRHLIVADLKKAKVESEFRELQRPERQIIYNFSTVTEVLEWLAYYETVDIVAFDIEVLNYEVSCISFSSDPSLAISIPIDGKWTDYEEVQIWRGIQRVLGNPKSIKIIQNSIFDIHFLLTKNGVEVRGPVHDTMIAHHIMYSELPKGLAFLVSIYGGAQEYYKDMVKFNDIKDES